MITLIRWSIFSAQFGARRGGGASHGLVVHVGSDEAVELRIRLTPQADFAGAFGAQEARPLATQRQHVLCCHAEVVLRVGVGHSVSDPFVVRRGDVSNSVGGAIEPRRSGCSYSGAAEQKRSGLDDRRVDSMATGMSFNAFSGLVPSAIVADQTGGCRERLECACGQRQGRVDAEERPGLWWHGCGCSHAQRDLHRVGAVAQRESRFLRH